MIIDTKEWISLKEAQKIIDRTSQTIKNWVDEGLVSVKKIGIQNFYKKSDLINTFKKKMEYHHGKN